MDDRSFEQRPPGPRLDAAPQGAPLVVVALIAALVLVHLVLSLLPEGSGEEIEQALAFIPARYASDPLTFPGGSLALITSPLSYMIVHADWSHLAINGVWLLVFGTMVARRTGALKFMTLTIATGFAGILAFWLFHQGEQVPVIGASGAVSGLMAAAVRLMHAAALERSGPFFMLVPLGPVPRLAETLRDRQTRILIGVWLALNVLAAFAVNLFAREIGIAWEVHLGGFLLGLFAFPAFDRVGAQGVPPDHGR